MNINNITNNLATHLGAVAIVCYGSYANGSHDAASDIDLLVLMPDGIPDEKARKTAYSQAKVLELDKKLAGEWDTFWSPVNDRIEIEGQVIEIGYNTKARVLDVIDKLIHKHDIHFAFRPYTLLGLLEECRVLYDKEGFIDTCRSMIRPIPTALKQAIIAEFLPKLKESVDDLEDCAKRTIGILAYLFFLERAIDAMIQLLFISNDVYDPASKRTEHKLKALKHLPKDIFVFLNEILPRFYEHKDKIVLFFREILRQHF